MRHFPDPTSKGASMFSSEFFLLAGAHLLALASPGPDFLLLVRGSLRHGRPYGLGASLGIALANGLYIGLALAGFSLLQQSPWLLAGMQWLASLYLAWLGWMFMRASLRPAPLPGALAGSHPRAGAGVGMMAGFLSALLNPKNGLFYFGLFTLMGVGRYRHAAQALLWLLDVCGGAALGCRAGLRDCPASRDGAAGPGLAADRAGRGFAADDRRSGAGGGALGLMMRRGWCGDLSAACIAAASPPRAT